MIKKFDEFVNESKMYVITKILNNGERSYIRDDFNLLDPQMTAVDMFTGGTENAMKFNNRDDAKRFMNKVANKGETYKIISL